MKEKFVDASGSIWGVHSGETCKGSHCAIHNPSDHPLKDAPIRIRGANPFSLKPHGFIERVCPCGIGHSDPDSVAYFESRGIKGTDIHGCCGHCIDGAYEKLNGDSDV